MLELKRILLIHLMLVPGVVLLGGYGVSVTRRRRRHTRCSPHRETRIIQGLRLPTTFGAPSTTVVIRRFHSIRHHRELLGLVLCIQSRSLVSPPPTQVISCLGITTISRGCGPVVNVLTVVGNKRRWWCVDAVDGTLSVSGSGRR